MLQKGSQFQRHPCLEVGTELVQGYILMRAVTSVQPFIISAISKVVLFSVLGSLSKAHQQSSPADQPGTEH